MTDMIRAKAVGFIALSVLLFGSAGCVKNETPGKSGEEGEKQPVFTFSTRADYTLTVQYDVPEGYQVHFRVYTENPFTTDADGQQVKRSDVEPIDGGYTDGSGNYSGKISMSAAVEKLYICTSDAGVPRLMTAEVKGGVLSAASVPYAGTSKAATKAVGGVNAVNKVDFPDVQTNLLGGWMMSQDGGGFAELPAGAPGLYGTKAKLWGRPDYLRYMDQGNFTGGSPALEIEKGILDVINAVLPGEGNGEVDPAVLKSGDIHVTKDAEIDLYLLDEQCLYLNVLAYYCYPTGHAPASAADIKVQTIAFPDAKIIKSHSAYMNNQQDYGAMLSGEGIRLHYVDGNGVDQGTTFPAGTSIGWIVYSNGFNMREVWMQNGTPVVGKLKKSDAGVVYSDPALMGGVPHVAVFRYKDFVVTSFEDCAKMNPSDVRDFKDVICHVASTPSDAITDNVPDVNPEQPDDKTVVSEAVSRGILSFEDNWPYRGDFDMNDVVVKYETKIGMNKKNEVLETTDNFTILWSGAAYNNSFAYRNDNLAQGSATVSFSGGDGTAYQDLGDNKTIVRVAKGILKYANEDEKLTFTVVSKFQNPIARNNFVMPPYNPFIMIEGDATREVHLTNAIPTSYAETKWFGYGHDKSKPGEGIYYITYDENGDQMPFAMDLAFDDDATMNSYVIPKESEPINDYYPGFMRWVKSGGTQDKDWYLHPVSGK